MEPYGTLRIKTLNKDNFEILNSKESWIKVKLFMDLCIGYKTKLEFFENNVNS